MPGNGPWIHGRAVDPKTRQLRFLSVSAIESADTAAGGCTRKWWYEKIDGRKPPESPWQTRGVEGHACVANYLTTGAREFVPLVGRGLHMIPEPGPDLLVEWELLLRPGVVYPKPLTQAHSPELLANAPLVIAGIPLLGQLDLAHRRGINIGADDSEAYGVDPKGTAEVLDWKFVGGDKYLKTPEQLRRTTQMCAYAEWVWLVQPDTTHVRMSHGYFCEKGRPRKVTTLVRREDIQPQLEHAAGVARTMSDAAKCTDPEHVDANTDACDKYGGCAHREYCTARKVKSFSSLVGKTAAESMIHPSQGVIPVSSLLQRANGGASPLLQQPQQPTQQTPAVQQPDPNAVAAEQARLLAEQEAAKIRALAPPGFVDACNKVRSFNRGFPKLTGAAAQAFAAIGGQRVGEGAEFPGSGEISYVTISDPLVIVQLSEELAKEASVRPTSPIPPDAPASDPAIAAQGGAAMTQPAPSAPAPSSPLPAPVPESTIPVTDQVAQMPTPLDPMKQDTAPAKKTRTRKVTQTQSEQTNSVGEITDNTVGCAQSAPRLYIDCVTTEKTISLNEWAQEQADKIARKFGAIDIRCGAEDSAIGYDKWKGALVAWCRDPECSPLPEGSALRIETRFSAVMTAAAEGLELRIRAAGGLVTRGLR